MMSGDKSLKMLKDKDYLTAREIPGFPGYLISLSGRVYSIKELKPLHHSDGYLRVCLYGSKRGKFRKGVHQLLAITYLTRGPHDTEVRHLNGNKKDNQIENLLWGTRQINANDMARHGSVAGEKNPKAYLTNEKVISIRREFLTGNFTKMQLSKKYKVSWQSIKNIVSRKSWKHL